MRWLHLLLVMCLCVLPGVSRAMDLSLYALFKNKAILKVDGSRRVLAVGDTSTEGVKLISTDTETEEAVVDVQGKRQTLKLGVIQAAFTSSSARESVTLYADSNGSFHAEGSINGTPVKFLVDTGATTVAINSATARNAGIDYKKGQAGVAKTAGGFTRAYSVTLATVKVGDITMHNVEAGVIEGSQPDVPLLGMSFLNAMEMRRDGNRMDLTKQY
jgi:aspartyl protease family protein